MEMDDEVTIESDDVPIVRTTAGGVFLSKLKLLIIVLLFAVHVVIILILAAVLGVVEAEHRRPTKEKLVNPTTSPTPRAGLWSDVRLPDFAEPLHYDIHMNIDPNKDTFTGDEQILVNVNRTTSVILLHSNALNITDVTIKTSHDKRLVAISNRFDFKKNFFHVIETVEPMTPAKYVFTLKFERLFRDDCEGLYKGTYKTDGKKVNFAATIFQPMEARAMFPCFDEPAFKATFNMSVTHPNDLMALSNNALRTQTQQDSLTRSSFEQTPKMQTYLVSVAVGKFESKETTSKNGVKLRVIAQPGRVAYMELALSIASETLTQLEGLFGIRYPMPKLDLIAPPKCEDTADDWGLVRFEEIDLYYREGFSSEHYRHNLVAMISHQLVHMWFGNLVTMKWWNDLWIIEGFAMYFSFFDGLPKSEDVKWNGKMGTALFLTELFSEAMNSDSFVGSRPVIAKKLDMDNIFHDGVDKASSLLRMLKSTFPDQDKFNEGVKKLLRENSYGNIDSDDVWRALQSACPKKECGDIKEIMDPWMRTEGYPVLTISKSDTAGEYIVQQERFVFDNTAKRDNNLWSVYFTYYSGSKCTNVKKVAYKWITNKMSQVTISWDGNGWLKGNVDQTGFYRVNYDDITWKNLADQLEYNHKVFSESDRYGLIDDAFNLARGRRVNITQAFNLLNYLRNETDYLPWLSVKKNVGYILSILPPNSNIHQQLKRYLAYQSKLLYDKLGTGNSGTPIDKSLRSTIVGFQCDVGLKSCLDNVTTMFDAWKKDPMTTSVTPSLRGLVYYYGVRQGNQKDWERMLDRVFKSKIPSEIHSILDGLTGTRDTWNLHRYLHTMGNLSIDHSHSILENVVDHNPEGPEVAWGFLHLKQNEESFLEDIPIVSQRFSTPFQLQQLTYFIGKNLNGQPMPRSLLKVLQVVRLNIAWRGAHEKDLGRWLTTFLANNNA